MLITHRNSASVKCPSVQLLKLHC